MAESLSHNNVRLIAYDTTDVSSLENLSTFVLKGKTIIVGNKADEPSAAKDREAAKRAATELSPEEPHFLVSAKTGANLAELWTAMVEKIYPDTVKQHQHSAPAPRVLSIDELKEHWDAFAKVFSEQLSLSTTAMGVNMLSFMKMPQAHSVLEIASGSGQLAKIALQNYLSPTAHYTAVDLSPEMVRITKATLEALGPQVANRLTIREANAEALPFENAHFDRVISNYVLHLTEKPENMVAEISRVLRSGGIAGFTVWGRPEHSPQFTINASVLRRMGVDMKPSSRSPFHLHDMNKTRELVRQAGAFSRVVAYYSQVGFDVFSGEEYRARTEQTETTKSMFKQANLTPEQIELFWRYAGEEIERLLAEGTPLRHEALIVVAWK